MKQALYSLTLLALVGCQTEGSPVEDTEVVRALSRAAVEELTPEEVLPEEVLEFTGGEAMDLTESVPAAEPPLAMPVVEAVPEERDVEVAAFELRRGETLAHFARWSDVPVEEIASTSQLDLGGIYPVGTEILIPADSEQASRIEERRRGHHDRRVESYLGTRGGALGDEVYAVRTGDSAWKIARVEYDVPVWVLESYNPGVNLDRLTPGMELTMPIIADTVVDAE